MNCRCLIVLISLAVLSPATARSEFIYQFSGLPATPIAPGTEVPVQVLLAESGGGEFSPGITTATVQMLFGPGLVLNSITSGPAWSVFFTESNLVEGTWASALDNPMASVTANPVLLATYRFTANQTTSFTAAGPLIFQGLGGNMGAVGDLDGNVFPITSAGGTIDVVPEPSSLVGWGTALFAMAGFGWTRTRRLRRR